MLKRLLERLSALDEAAEAIRSKVESKGAKNLDALVLAEVLLYVDKVAGKLATLEKQLQVSLFDGQGESS